MRLSTIVSEAGRNLASGTSRALTSALAVAAIATTLAVLDARSIVALEREADAYRQAGAAIWLVEASSGIDGHSCERLADLDGIVVSGALRGAGRASAPGAPDSSIPHYEGSPAFSRLVGTPVADGAMVTRGRLVTDLGLLPGSEANLGPTPLPITGIYDFPGGSQRPALEAAAISIAPRHTTYDECWAEIWPGSARASQYLVLALSPSVDADAYISTLQLTSTLGQSFDGAQRFEARQTRWVAVVGLASGLLLGLAFVRARRLELASARHAGVRWEAQSLQLSIEALAWATAGVVLSLPAILYAVHDGVAFSVAALDAAGRTVIATGSAAVVSTFLAVLQIRERQYLELFKAR